MWRRAFSRYVGTTSLRRSRPVVGPLPKSMISLPFLRPESEERFGIDSVFRTLRLERVDSAFKHDPYQSGQLDQFFDARDLATSLTRLESATISMSHNVEGAQPNDHHWLVVRLLRDKVHTPKDVLAATRLVNQSLSSFPSALHPSLVVIVAFWAVRYRMDASLDKMVTAFLDLDPEPLTAHYNLLLVILSYGARGREPSMRVARFLNWTRKRGHEVYSNTYLELLKRRFATVALAEQVKAHMLAQGIEPSHGHVLALLTIAARSGNKRLISEYAGLVKAYAQEERAARISSQMEDGVMEAPDQLPLSNRATVRGIEAADDDRFLGDRSSHIPDPLEVIDDFPSPSHAVASNIETTRGDKSLDYPSSHDADSPVEPSWYPLYATESVPGLQRVRAAIYATRRWKGTAPAVIQFFRRAIANLKLGDRDILGLYTMVVMELAKRGAFKEAAQIWMELRTVTRFDIVAIIVGIKTLPRAGQAATVVDVFEEIYQTARDERYQRRRPRDIPQRPRVSAALVSRFAIALSEIQRVDAVFLLWDHMRLLYQVSPNTYMLNAMLRCARLSKKHSNSVRGAIVQLGLGRFLRRSAWTPEDEIMDPRDRIAAQLRRILSTPTEQTGMWRGEPGHRVGLRIATHIILANSPKLLQVQSPVQALRESGDSIGSSPMSEFTKAMRSYTQSQETIRPSRLLAWAGPPPPQYANPTISMTDISFKQYIHLLAANDLSAEIPLVLAWMQALNVKPSQRTIAIALVYWRTVSTDAPLIEAMKGGVDRSPYARLERWLEEWVGRDGMPPDLAIGDAMRSIEAFNNLDSDSGGALEPSEPRRRRHSQSRPRPQPQPATRKPLWARVYGKPKRG